MRSRSCAAWSRTQVELHERARRTNAFVAFALLGFYLPAERARIRRLVPTFR